MKFLRLHPFSLCIGCAVATLAFFAMSQNPAPAASTWEYKIGIDLAEGDVRKLAADGYEFVGYLGQSTRGLGSDETLWRRHAK